MKRIMKKAAENFLKSKIIPNWRLSRYALACQLQELFNFLAIETILDVGANEGQYGEFLREEVGFTGAILSFEPANGPYAILEKKAQKDPKWHSFLMALGAEEATEQLNEMRGSQFNSLLDPRHDTLSLKGNVVTDTYEVKVQTLSNMWPELQNKFDLNAVYLKLDTQGFDLKVLQGAENILHNIKALQSEMSVIPIYEGMPNYKEAIQYLENKDFALSGMHPVNLDSDMRLIEFDGIFVNNDNPNK